MAADMIVDLREFFATQRAEDSGESRDVNVRRAEEADRERLATFITAEFGERWARGMSVAYARKPTSSFVAIRDDEIIGFAFYDIAFLGYFGAMGVRETDRGCGVGARLLLLALGDMARKGYAYAIIGDVGPIDFYKKVCGAIVIPKPE